MALDYEPLKAIRALKRKDPVLGRLITAIGVYKLGERRLGSPFKSLLRAIVFQQLSTKAAGAIHKRLLDLFPHESHPSPEQILAIDYEQLRTAGLSHNKTLAAQDLALKTIEGLVPSRQKLRHMQDNEIIERLVAVRGVGRWTVEMLLIFELGRADVFPVTDLGIRKGYQIGWQLADMPEPKALHEYGEIWRPYRSVASWYLWRATDSLPT